MNEHAKMFDLILAMGIGLFSAIFMGFCFGVWAVVSNSPENKYIECIRLLIRSLGKMGYRMEQTEKILSLYD